MYAASLKKHTDNLLKVMSDVLLNPSFNEEEFEKVKKQTLSGLATSKDDPNAIAGNVGQTTAANQVVDKAAKAGFLTTGKQVLDVAGSGLAVAGGVLGIKGAKDAEKRAEQQFQQAQTPLLSVLEGLFPGIRQQLAASQQQFTDAPQRLESAIRRVGDISTQQRAAGIRKAGELSLADVNRQAALQGAIGGRVAAPQRRQVQQNTAQQLGALFEQAPLQQAQAQVGFEQLRPSFGQQALGQLSTFGLPPAGLSNLLGQAALQNQGIGAGFGQQLGSA